MLVPKNIQNKQISGRNCANPKHSYIILMYVIILFQNVMLLIRSSPFVQNFENEATLVPNRTLIRFAIEH